MGAAGGLRVRRDRAPSLHDPASPGLSQDVVAGLAGISKQHVSMLEGGKRRFERRGLIEDFAAALGCAVADVSVRYPIPARTEVPTHVRTARRPDQHRSRHRHPGRLDHRPAA
ncbi:MAG: helix-turn-helix domain-containing protein [Pseudonocardiaceae bacterium]